jgi:hypothetical protein
MFSNGIIAGMYMAGSGNRGACRVRSHAIAAAWFIDI